MPSFYLIKEKYKKKNITFIYHYQTKRWYLIRNEVIEILFNPKLPSSYWCHLRNKYLNKNIVIDKFIKTIKVTSNDNKIHPKKVISLNNVIKLIKIFDIEDKTDLIDYINNTSKTKLYILENELEINKIINNYLKLGYSKKEIQNIFSKYLSQIKDD